MSKKLWLLTLALLAMSLLLGGRAFADGSVYNGSGNPQFEPDDGYQGCPDTGCISEVTVYDDINGNITYSLEIDPVTNILYFGRSDGVQITKWHFRASCYQFSDLHLFITDDGLVHLRWRADRIPSCVGILAGSSGWECCNVM